MTLKRVEGKKKKEKKKRIHTASYMDWMRFDKLIVNKIRACVMFRSTVSHIYKIYYTLYVF